MLETPSRSKLRALLLGGILGCILMAGSDWLMIYGDTAFSGSLAWLTDGVAQIPAWRNSLALALAFPAVVLYALGLFGLRFYLHEPRQRRSYCGLTAVGMTPWLCLHLFYVMILFLFAWLHGSGYAADAAPICEAMFGHFSWVVLPAEVFMVLPFLYFFYVTAAGKTVLPRLAAINNPLVIYLALKALTLILPDTAFRLAFVNGLMSESMAIWFVLLMVLGLRHF